MMMVGFITFVILTIPLLALTIPSPSSFGVICTSVDQMCPILQDENQVGKDVHCTLETSCTLYDLLLK